MHVRPSNPVIVQADGKVLVEANHRDYEKTREFLTKFAELESSPNSLHTYKITSISLWNAASSGLSTDEIIDGLNALSKYPMPREVEDLIAGTLERYGLVKLVPHPDDDNRIRIELETAYIQGLIVDDVTINDLIIEEGRGRKRTYSIQAADRGTFKQRTLLANWPVEDLAGFKPGSKLPIPLRPTIKNTNVVFEPVIIGRALVAGIKKEISGHGVIVLACGGGKTIVGITAMHLVQRKTLILATAKHQLLGG